MGFGFLSKEYLRKMYADYLVATRKPVGLIFNLKNYLVNPVILSKLLIILSKLLIAQIDKF